MVPPLITRGITLSNFGSPEEREVRECLWCTGQQLSSSRLSLGVVFLSLSFSISLSSPLSLPLLPSLSLSLPLCLSLLPSLSPSSLLYLSLSLFSPLSLFLSFSLSISSPPLSLWESSNRWSGDIPAYMTTVLLVYLMFSFFFLWCSQAWTIDMIYHSYIQVSPMKRLIQNCTVIMKCRMQFGAFRWFEEGTVHAFVHLPNNHRGRARMKSLFTEWEPKQRSPFFWILDKEGISSVWLAEWGKGKRMKRIRDLYSPLNLQLSM